MRFEIELPDESAEAIRRAAQAGATRFSKSGITASGIYNVRATVNDAGGGSQTNLFVPFSCAGLVTSTVTPAVNTTTTNSWSVKVIYSN